jgi:hypothetical protein
VFEFVLNLVAERGLVKGERIGVDGSTMEARSTSTRAIIVAAPIHAADEGETTTLSPTLEMAEKNLSAVGVAPTPEDPCDLVANKGYHSRDVLKDQIAEPRPSKRYLRWHGDGEGRAAV